MKVSPLHLSLGIYYIRNDYYLQNIYSIPDTVLGIIYILAYLILQITLL